MAEKPTLATAGDRCHSQQCGRVLIRVQEQCMIQLTVTIGGKCPLTTIIIITGITIIIRNDYIDMFKINNN